MDAGCEGCAPLPDAGLECSPAHDSCQIAACCPGLGCDAGLCEPLPNPCPPGEQPLDLGCGCDPSLDQGGGCGVGQLCFEDLHCHPAADGGPSPGPPGSPARVGEPCDPAAGGADGGPAGGCDSPDGSLAVDCLPDPSGAALYRCAQSCQRDSDCPLAWQACGSSFAAPGHCGDSPCGAFPPAPGDEARFFTPCTLSGGEPGLCLPFGGRLLLQGGSVTAVSYGLCVASDPGAAAGAACAQPPSRTFDGGLCGPGELCAKGLCRPPCNAAADGGDAGCPSGESCLGADLGPAVPGVAFAAGGCAPACELDAGGCDAGAAAPGADGGQGARLDAGG